MVPQTPADFEPAPPADGRAARALRQRALTRERILAAAADVFAARGYAAASVSDILEAAKIARGTFYLHFESKEAALGAVLENFVASLANVLRPVTTRSPEAARDELVANLVRALELLDNAPELSRLIFSYAAALPPELGAHLDRFYDGATALILRALNAGARLGLVKPGDQALRARLILGAFIEAARPHPTPPRDAHGRRELALAMLDFALSGVLADPRLVAPLVSAASRPNT